LFGGQAMKSRRFSPQLPPLLHPAGVGRLTDACVGLICFCSSQLTDLSMASALLWTLAERE
jgi:hypothetical protein